MDKNLIARYWIASIDPALLIYMHFIDKLGMGTASAKAADLRLSWGLMEISARKSNEIALCVNRDEFSPELLY